MTSPHLPPHLLPTFDTDSAHTLPELLQLQLLVARGYRSSVCRDLRRHAPDSALPDRARVLRTVRNTHSRRVLAEVDDTLVLLESWRSDGQLWVSADAEEAAIAVADEIQARVPRHTEDGVVEVTFSDADTGSRTLPLDVRPWPDVAHLYAPGVGSSLEALTAHTPDVGTSRRLVLWHGVPGTGKTTAVRALVHSWRDWSDVVVVTDPESLLKDGKYLRRVLLDVDEEERWTLFVLEDAEALLRKETGGPAMGKLLNLADGLLGQGLRCLFLITTNEPLGAIHPAIVRPGRCLAQVEFTPLPAGQAAGLLGRPVDRPMTLADVMGTAPVRTAEAPVAVGQYL